MVNTASLRQISLLDVLGSYGVPMRYKGKDEYGGDCPICGDKNGFSVDMGKRMWFCHRAYKRRNHKHYGDVINLVELIERVEFMDAVRILEQRNFGHVEQTAATYPSFFLSKSWINRNNEFQANLVQTSWATSYLEQRAIELETAIRYGVGCGYRQHVAAMTLAWYDRSGELVSGRYRLLDGCLRYACWKGCSVKDRLYGWHALSHRRHDTLLIVEGEWNCISINQAMGDAVDVLSTGSENFLMSDEVVEQVAPWPLIYLWVDSQVTLDKWLAALPQAKGWTSPVKDGQKFDANAILQRGTLRTYLEQRMDNR